MIETLVIYFCCFVLPLVVSWALSLRYQGRKRSALDQLKSKGLEASVPADTHYMKVNKYDYRLHWDRWVKDADLTALYDMQDAMHGIDAPKSPLEEMCEQNVALKAALTEEQQRTSQWYARYKNAQKTALDLEAKAAKRLFSQHPPLQQTSDITRCASCLASAFDARSCGYKDNDWTWNKSNHQGQELSFLLCPVCSKSYEKQKRIYANGNLHTG